MLEVKTRNYGLWGWLSKLCTQNKHLNSTGSPKPKLSDNSPYRMRSIEELTEEQYTDEKSNKKN